MDVDAYSSTSSLNEVSEAGKKTASSSKSSSADQNYGVDEAKLTTLRTLRPFLKDPKYFKNVQISPSATMKMMMHVQSGVEKGIKSSLTGKPTEVMGLLVGHQDTVDPHSFIVSDAQALPIEGFETSVVAQSDDVLSYQINLLAANEKTRHSGEKFCGWYHSHPFDLEEYSHCYLSNTDVQTQLAWQRSVERDGDPWLAVVIDPLRSIAKGYPNMESFRVYPPEYTGVPNEAPDGTIISDEKTRLSLWGNCWNRYYKLNTTFYMSSLASDVLGMLKDNFLWQNSFTSTPLLDTDAKQTTADRMKKIARDIESIGDSLSRGVASARDRDPDETSQDDRRLGGTKTKANLLGKAASAACALSNDHCSCACSQMAKLAMFGNPNSSTTRELLKIEIEGRKKALASSKYREEAAANVFSSTLTKAQAVSITGDPNIRVNGAGGSRAPHHGI